MLKEISVAEQRYQAVLAVLEDGLTVTEVATKLGDRPTERPWVAASVCRRRLGRSRGPVTPSAVMPTSNGP